MDRPKPTRWRRSHDAQSCVECMERFIKGDRVINDVALTVHNLCWDQYQETRRDLGFDHDEA